MVTNITNFGRSGLYDWVIQRVTAVILAVYTIFMLAYFFRHPDLQYPDWKDLFSHTWMRIFSLLAVVSLVAHAWIGLWIVSTDYLTTHLLGNCATALRFLFQLGCGILLFIYFVWSVQILWTI